MPDFALPTIRHVNASKLQTHLAAKRARYAAIREKNERAEDLWGGARGGDSFARFRDDYRVHEEAAYMSWRKYLFHIAQSSSGVGGIGKENLPFERVLKMARAQTERQVLMEQQSAINKKVTFNIEDFFDNTMNVYRVKHVYNYLIKKKYKLLEKSVLHCCPRQDDEASPSSELLINDVPFHRRSKYNRIFAVLAQVEDSMLRLDSEDGFLYTTSRLSYSKLKSVQETLREFQSFLDRLSLNRNNILEYSDDLSDYTNLKHFCRNVSAIKKQFGSDDSDIIIEGSNAFTAYHLDSGFQTFHFRNRLTSAAEIAADNRHRSKMKELIYTSVLSTLLSHEAASYLQRLHNGNDDDYYGESGDDDRAIADYLRRLRSADEDERRRQQQVLGFAANVLLLGAVTTLITSLFMK